MVKNSSNQPKGATFKYVLLDRRLETILFPQDMIQDIYKLHWNAIHKSTGLTWFGKMSSY